MIMKIKRRSLGIFGRENPNQGNRVEHEKLEERVRGAGERDADRSHLLCKKKNLESRGSCCDFNQLTFSIKEG